MHNENRGVEMTMLERKEKLKELNRNLKDTAKQTLSLVTKILINSVKSGISEYKRTKYLPQEKKDKGNWGIITPGNLMSKVCKFLEHILKETMQTQFGGNGDKM